MGPLQLIAWPARQVQQLLLPARGGPGDGEEGGDAIVRTGLHVLHEEGFARVRGRRCGLVANATSVLPDLTHAVDLLHGLQQQQHQHQQHQQHQHLQLVALFGPEHGFRGSAQAGRSEEAGRTRDGATGLPLFDIYRKQRHALAQVFTEAGVEVVLFDMQDVGARFYTYIWTLYDTLVAAALSDGALQVLVLDRPNPLGGLAIEGPLMQRGCESFVGRRAIPIRHGMTVGELARLFNAEFVPDDAGGRRCDLHVVPMQGWKRHMLYRDTGLPWVPPSPNMPTPETALVYAGTCLLEGTNVSEGRGTTLPFHLFGAPWMDQRLRAALNEEELHMRLREAYFVPTFAKFAGQNVVGCQVHVQNPWAFNAVAAGVAILVALRKLYPDDFQWRGDHFIDKLAGTPQLRRSIDAGCSLTELQAQWEDDLTWFATLRAPYLLPQYS
mmetsp:Transcript_6200/g.22810  ORF Transcript_6200/g.22810 Transcript_6200/m.22810 type:complete len:440 (-) Transcript_6200:165-1484(-)